MNGVTCQWFGRDFYLLRDMPGLAWHSVLPEPSQYPTSPEEGLGVRKKSIHE